MKGLKIRVQATATEDAMFPAYGAQTVHMPFGSVYTSLQTGVVDVAENSVNVYLVNKHYEVAPVLSMTEHEANNALLFDQRQAVAEPLRRAEEVGADGGRAKSAPRSRRKAFELEKTAATKLKRMGVKIVEDVDKKSFHEDRRSLSRQARQGARPARREDQEPDPGDQLELLIRESSRRTPGPIRRGPSV